MTRIIATVGVVGAGEMGKGIAQIAAQAGLKVFLLDNREGAASAAVTALGELFGTLVAKGKLPSEAAEAARALLVPVRDLTALGECDLVVEAIVEDLSAKRTLLQQLEDVVSENCILATNTSSLSVTAIAAACRHPLRVAGLHFFNPVPLMRVVEVIGGSHTDEHVVEALLILSERLGHRGVRAKDTPGFIVNHAGRAYGTEALRMAEEGIASFDVIDRILREGVGLRMGPFELFDLTALDVSHPAMEAIYAQFYNDPRYRPSYISRQRLAAGLTGRKAGSGFYDYVGGKRVASSDEPPLPFSGPVPPIWLEPRSDDEDGSLRVLLQQLGAIVEEGDRPSASALCLLSPLGDDGATSAVRAGVDPRRTVCIDLFTDLHRHRTLMVTPATDADMIAAARTLFGGDGVGVSVIRDSLGFVAQRALAMVVNTACEIAQQQIATPADIDSAVQLGLGYPMGPLAWGDSLGAGRIFTILDRIYAISGDPRYRPSAWLRRRAQLGLSLSWPEPSVA
jgi:3-hydroxybutyryl-CoA dehydrogenase